MIYVTQLVYLIPGQEKTFDEFERVAIPLISKHNGRLVFRVRPTDDAFIEHHADKPYEIHLVEFDSQQDFDNFKKDEERKKFLHLKEQSIKSSVMIQGTKLGWRRTIHYTSSMPASPVSLNWNMMKGADL